RRLGNLKHDLLSVNIARDTIHSQLEAHKGRILPGAYGTHFVANVDWVAAQMASDIAYFDTAKQCGNAIMGALRLKAEDENTEAEHRMLFASLVIADLIIGVTAVVGVWTIAHDIITEQVTTEHVREIVTILVSAGISLLVGCLTIYLCWKSLRLLLPERYR